MKTVLCALTLVLASTTAPVVYVKAPFCDVETGKNCQPPRRQTSGNPDVAVRQS
jgi:hypothetical protein